MADEGSVLAQWQKLQKELHELERTIAFGAARGRSRKGKTVVRGALQEQAIQLREEVEALFPAAMRQLEEDVARLSARRHRLRDERA